MHKTPNRTGQLVLLVDNLSCSAPVIIFGKWQKSLVSKNRVVKVMGKVGRDIAELIRHSSSVKRDF